MQHFVEPRIRTLVADHLGVRPEELTAEVSLVDDLAADSLDMIELAIAVEDALDISIPERTIDRVRSFGDLVEIIAHGLACRREAEFLAQAPVLLARARLIPRETRRHRALERSVWLTPYAVELLLEDAVAAGSGCRLEILLDADCSASDISRVADRFSRLRERGCAVEVQRAAAASGSAHPDAA